MGDQGRPFADRLGRFGGDGGARVGTEPHRACISQGGADRREEDERRRHGGAARDHPARRPLVPAADRQDSFHVRCRILRPPPEVQRRVSGLGSPGRRQPLLSGSRSVPMIDTHAHTHVDAFDQDRAKVLTRAFASGLEALIEINIVPEAWPRVLRLAQSDPRIFATAGLHPNEVGQRPLEDLRALERRLGHPRVRAVGETGLDYYRDRTDRARQQEFFRRHIHWARETRLPLVVHCRRAHEDVLRMIEEEGRGGVRGVMHCFSGTAEQARRSRELGFRIGLGGSITYDAAHWAPLLREIGPGDIVVETDCPFLAPEPYRGRRNEPAYVWRTAEVLAAYLEQSVEEVERATDEAARRLFGLQGPGA
ncbi:MAG: YchF/TatD family DNA exonuclease [Candidatus Eisenbacteria bacterium]|nr:YchF/TatD family DNA exonuclease [Candidatus Eisenbacteria bacterium]